MLSPRTMLQSHTVCQGTSCAPQGVLELLHDALVPHNVGGLDALVLGVLDDLWQEKTIAVVRSHFSWLWCHHGGLQRALMQFCLAHILDDLQHLCNRCV